MRLDFCTKRNLIKKNRPKYQLCSFYIEMRFKVNKIRVLLKIIKEINQGLLCFKIWPKKNNISYKDIGLKLYNMLSFFYET